MVRLATAVTVLVALAASAEAGSDHRRSRRCKAKHHSSVSPSLSGAPAAPTASESSSVALPSGDLPQLANAPTSASSAASFDPASTAGPGAQSSSSAVSSSASATPASESSSSEPTSASASSDPTSAEAASSTESAAPTSTEVSESSSAEASSTEAPVWSSTEAPASSTESATPTSAGGEGSVPVPSATASAAPAESEQPSGPLSGSDSIGSAILGQINNWRREFGVSELAWSDDAAGKAWDQAQQCSWTVTFPDSQQSYPDVQTLLIGTSDFIRGIDVLMEQTYNYDTPGLGGDNVNARGYTNILWRETTNVGCSWNRCESMDERGKLLLTCMFDAHGSYDVNNTEAFKENVPPRP